MNIIKLKTFFNRCIYQSNSGLRVYQNLFYRWLTFNTKPIQTLLRRAHPSRPMLSYLTPLTIGVRTLPADTCLLGLGGGGALHFLENKLQKGMLDAVEASSEVISIARRYFYVDELRSSNIIHQKAEYFIRHCSKQYHHILIDLFTESAFPKACFNTQFFERCFERLKPGGVLAINIACTQQYEKIFKFIYTICGNAMVSIPIDKSANIMLLASHSLSSDQLIKLIEKEHKIINHHWDTTFGRVVRIRAKL